MRLAIVSYNLVKKNTLDEYIHDLSESSTFQIAKELTKLDYEITFYYRAKFSKELILNGIKIIFVKDNKRQRPLWYVPWKIHKAITLFKPDIIHIQGMIFPFQTFILYRQMSSITTMIIQNHAERPRPGPLLLLQYLFFRNKMFFQFTAYGQENEWLRLGVLRSKKQIHHAMEGSNFFKYEPRSLARQKTGINDQVVFIWIGNLNANKDPITVLNGFEKVAITHPEVCLYMIYKETTLLTRVMKKIEESKVLKKSVKLLGEIAHNEVEDWLNSADYFLAGSQKEGSGYAVAEALACGVVPVVTDIPSFYMMTDEGKFGALWQTDKADSLADAIYRVLNKNLKEESIKASSFFTKHLSPKAIAKRLNLIYKERNIEQTPIKL